MSLSFRAVRRGIAILPVEGWPLFRDDGDSSTPRLRRCARNDKVL